MARNNDTARDLPSVVLVAIDYSDSSARALLGALEQADLMGAELHAAHVMDPAERGVDGKLPVQEDEARLHDFVESHLKTWPNRAATRIRAVVIHLAVGKPADELVELAADLDADLLVVGTHGRRGVQRLLLGSVAEHLVRLSPKPVLIVPDRAKAVDSTVSITPPCPRCVAVRRASEGRQLWCDEHLGRHGRRHTYHYVDRNVESHASDSLLIRI